MCSSKVLLKTMSRYIVSVTRCSVKLIDDTEVELLKSPERESIVLAHGITVYDSYKVEHT